MPKKIMRCRVCGKYTMRETCCGEKTASAHPPKFSPEDKYAHYRRIAKGIEHTQNKTINEEGTGIEKIRDK
ncbi:MAG: RNA-protein complex protein Nop10 [Candidatus Micrarchaeota archaeon]|nr:RNA-protein complex protein Nop10 [Candidatus Micrarchaeota archaeon]